MIISDLSVKNRVSVLVLTLIILILGLLAYLSLPRESSPDVTIPYVFISTVYSGVTSEDIEKSISIPIEKKVQSVENIKKIKSTSSEGISNISIEFLPGTNIDDALQKVKDKVDEAKNDLPEDLEDDPSVFEINLSERPIVIYALSGLNSRALLKEIADDLSDEIEGIKGVLEAEVTGGLEREIIIELDPDKLAYYKIPITSFSTSVPGENKNTSAGSLSLQDGKYQIRIPGEVENPNEIYEIIVSTHDGKPVYLKNVAKVIDGFKDEDSRTRFDGSQAVNIAVNKRSGENILHIIEKADELIAKSKKNLPSNLKISKLMDESTDIKNMVADLENNILSGLILVVVVLFFFLGFRNAVIVATSIPLSMFMTFVVFQILGITLNMVVLFSLSLALGMLVDNAIVLIENIYRYMELGYPRIKAAMEASSEIAYPIIGSTMTTIAAFAPMILWPGIMGDFMRYLPITLVITLLSSLVAALVINPALAAFFMRVKNKKNLSEEEREKLLKSEIPVKTGGFIFKAYSNTLRYALDNRIKTLIASFLFLILCFQIWLFKVGLEKPIEFFPDTAPNRAYVNIKPPEGAEIDYVDKIVKIIEMRLNNKENLKNEIDIKNYERTYKHYDYTDTLNNKYTSPSDIQNIKHIYATSSVAKDSSSFSISGDTNTQVGIQFIDFVNRKTNTKLDLNEIRTRIQDIAGATITVEGAEEGPPTGAPINIEISGDELSILGRLAKEVEKAIEPLPGVEDIRNDFIDSIPSIKIKVNGQRCAQYGLNTQAVGAALRTAYNGINISTYREKGEDYDITVKLSKSLRQTNKILYKLMLPTPSGELIPLTSLAQISYEGSFGDINRIDQERVVTVKANVDETVVPGAVARNQAQKLLQKLILPDGYKIKFTGESEFQQESQDFLEKVFIIAICLIFLILVTMFNSTMQPLIIIISVALSFGGVFLGLAFLNLPFGIIMTGVGVISLAGVVVNNAIVLIDYINKLRQTNADLKEAIIIAGATRLRPVLLTAITTILGLIPMVTGVSYDFHTFSISWVSESSQFWQSMAIVVIFGLTISTFLTLVVVPVLYSLIEGIKGKFFFAND